MSESQMAAYARDGFAVVRGFVSDHELRAIDEAFAACLASADPARDPKDFVFEDDAAKSLRCVFRLNERSAFFDALSRDPRLIALARRACDAADVVCDGVMLIDKAPHSTYEFPLHQDNAYQFWSPPDAVAITLALDPSDSESGAIVCLAGSHRVGIRPHQPSGVRGASRGLSDVPPAGRFPEAVLSLRPGDVSLHHVNVIHRTGRNRTGSRRRNLGFAYRSSRCVRDEAAFSKYESDLAEQRKAWTVQH